jgi:hypothetical protein
VAELAALQARFLALVVSGQGDPRGLIAGGELGIYAYAYGARLHEALRQDHPKLEAALGAEAFAALVAGYVAARPPRSFTLRDLGVDLARYLDDAATAPTPLAPPWAGDLARLERARVEVFDGPDHAALTRDHVAALGPEAIADLHLAWVPASAVVPLAWSVDAVWSALVDATTPPAAVAAPRTALVWRRDLEVIHRTLDPDEAAVAPRLVAGATFAEVCGALAELVDDPAPRALALLLRWLDAAALRLQADLHLPEGP